MSWIERKKGRADTSVISKQILISSATILILTSPENKSVISLMYNKRGPKMLPCGMLFNYIGAR